MSAAELDTWVPPPEEPPEDEPALGDLGVVPAAIPAEMAVLGALLHGQHLDHRDALTPDDFWRPQHRTIYAAIRTLADRGHLSDAVTVGQHLANTEKLLRVGGLEYLHTLLASAPVVGGLGYHVDLVAAAATRRRLRDAGLRAIQLAEHPGDDDLVGLVDRARATFDAVSASVENHDEHVGRGGWLTDLLTERTLEYELEQPVAIPTGFRDLDEYLGGGTGLQPGQLWVVGARPGVGKSLVTGSIGLNAARAGWGVGMFSLEMTRGEIVDRFVADRSGVPLDKLTSHDLDEHDWAKIRRARTDLDGTGLYVDDRPGLTIEKIRAKCRDLTRECELGLIVVDYLQLITAADRSIDRRVQVDQLSRELKLLAKEFHVVVVAAAQTNRGQVQRSDKAPVLSDLRESGSLEADADGVLFVHRDDHEGELLLILAKQRGGVSNRTVRLAWSGSMARLKDLYRGPEEAS